MSTLSKYKKLIEEYTGDSSLRTIRFNELFKSNPNIEDICQHFLDKYPELFSSLGEVIKALFLGKKIRRCVVCHKRLNFRSSNVLMHGQHILTCSKECKMARMDETVETRNNNNLKKYGVENVSMLTEVKKKKRDRALEVYGVENVGQAKEVKEKMKKTCLERYGVEIGAQSEQAKEKQRLRWSSLTKEEKDAIIKKCIKSARDKYFPKLREYLAFHNIEFVNEEDYVGWSHFNFRDELPQGYRLRCTKCGTEFNKIIRMERDPSTWCPVCNKGCRSFKEKDLATWLSKYVKIDRNDRTLIYPKELDIVIPDKKVAIEFDGLYYHSIECSGKDKNYHLEKTCACLEKGYQLIHIFEDEWIEKQAIVKRRLKSILGLVPYKIGARKCAVMKVDTKTSEKFLNKYHLQGFVNSSVRLGLFYKNRLVALMTFSKPRFNKNYDWELTRYCTVGSFSIVGGAGKLLSYFKKYHDGSIISYADRRWSNGNLYRELGFDEVGNTKPNYYYIKWEKRYNRMMFQKHKLKDILKTFDDNLSERENMNMNGYYTLYDCGNLAFGTSELKRTCIK